MWKVILPQEIGDYLRYYATFNFWKTQNMFQSHQITSNT